MNPDRRRAETLLSNVQITEVKNTFLPGGTSNGATLQLPLDLGAIRITEVLAKGGMGITFLGGRISEPTQRVVVKIPLTDDSHLLDRFKNEVRILSQLSHPNIVRFFEAGESDIPIGSSIRRLPWLAMEYVSGSSLRAILKQKSQLKWKDIQALLENLLQALDYLYSKNLCHRDIKPDNLIYDPQKCVWKLVDFGIAKELIDNLKLAITMVESNPGALDYMSPEQTQGRHTDIRSDIYSLGLTAWEALIGVVPRPGASFPSAMLGVENVPSDVDKLIAKMTSHHVGDRYQTPAEALNALHLGASAIEKKDIHRKNRIKAFRRITYGTSAAAVFMTIWFAGNQYATQQAKDIVDSVPTSDTKGTRLVKRLAPFRNKHAFWGRHYADQQYALAKSLADAELQKMREQFSALKKEFSDGGRSAEYMFNRCEAFCRTYEEVFGDTSEVKDMLIQKAISFAGTIATHANTLAASGHTKEAIQLCDQTKANTSLPEALALLTDTRAGIADVYARDKLVQVDVLINSTNLDDHVKARSGVIQIEQVVGPIFLTQSALNRVEARLDDDDWSTVSPSADKNIIQHTFKQAREDYQHYLNKWPNGRHTSGARAGLDRVVESHFRFLGEIKDYDDFQEELNNVFEMYPSEQGHLQSARKLLVYHVHTELGRLFQGVKNNSLQAGIALDKIGRLNWGKCEFGKRQYLDSLAEALKADLQAPSPRGAKYFLYIWQRPPEDCIKMDGEPSIYRFSVESIKVKLSNRVYARIKGTMGFDADPKIRIDLCRNNSTGNYPIIGELFNALGAVNSLSFSIPVNRSFLVEKDAEVLDTVLDDDDVTGDTNILRVIWTKPGIGPSQLSTIDFDDGSTIALYYSLQ